MTEASSEAETSREPSDSAASESRTDTISTSGSEMPYILKRAMGDHSTQWQRENRLTFFVRDHVSTGERDLVAAVESELGRDVPVFDVREAAYLVAQQYEEDVVDQLKEMGYDYE